MIRVRSKYFKHIEHGYILRVYDLWLGAVAEKYRATRYGKRGFFYSRVVSGEDLSTQFRPVKSIEVPSWIRGYY